MRVFCWYEQFKSKCVYLVGEQTWSELKATWEAGKMEFVKVKFIYKMF
jgi:hypothetical protein